MMFIQSSIVYSLDPVDPMMPLHPFQKVRFIPSALFCTLMFHCMLQCDYILKFLTVGSEGQCCDDQSGIIYRQRTLDEKIEDLPDCLKVFFQFYCLKVTLNGWWMWENWRGKNFQFSVVKVSKRFQRNSRVQFNLILSFQFSPTDASVQYLSVINMKNYMNRFLIIFQS